CALRPGWDWKSEEFIPQYGPFIGRFHCLRLFACLLPALISASLNMQNTANMGKIGQKKSRAVKQGAHKGEKIQKAISDLVHP
ncbi:hypothetical protein, partial [Oscillibacter sp. CU971]|uniref:hypothetical protein n=1 Tax=Oscillibacter sp. CU971 TaxID=2780102 RepID=UPI001957BDA7